MCAGDAELTIPPVMMDLRGKVAVVTGAAMGMGRCLSLRLRREGCNLALCDVDMDALEVLQCTKRKERHILLMYF